MTDNNHQPMRAALEAYRDVLTGFSEETLIRERDEEQKRWLALQVSYLKLRKTDPDGEEIKQTAQAIKHALENLEVIALEIDKRRAEGDVISPEEQQDAFERTQDLMLAQMLSMGQDIDEVLHTAQAMILRLASDLPTEQRYDPHNPGGRALTNAAQNAANILVEAWGDLKTPIRLIERALREIDQVQKFVNGERHLKRSMMAAHPDHDDDYGDAEIPF